MHTLKPEEALDLIAVRENLEVMAAHLAADNIDEQTLDALRGMLKQQKLIIQQSDMVEYSRADAGFHSVMYQSTGNVFLCELLGNIHSKLRPVAIQAREFMPIFYKEHVEIVDALAGHDPDLVEEKCRKHTQTIMGIIRSGKMTFISPYTEKP